MKITATIDNVALSALVFAVVAIAAVSTVAIVSADRLVSTNDKIVQTQRIVSSLEAIRFHSLLLGGGEQNYTITGNDRDLAPYRAAMVEIETELGYLATKKPQSSILAEKFGELESLARKLVDAERVIVEARKTAGFEAARALIKSHQADELLEKLLATTQKLLANERRIQDALESDQIAYGDKVRRLILALISSSGFILVFLYGTLRRLTHEQRASQARFAHQATHDSLTGLFNRHAVMDHISARLRDPETETALGGFALLLLDLDGFKIVNDTLGHDAGDELLKEASHRASLVLRESDYMARLGGDEFLVVIPQVSDQATAEHVAQKLIEAIGEPYLLHGNQASVTTSIGISLFPHDAIDREALMKCADQALYQAKHEGRNRLRFYEPGMRRDRRS